VTGPVAAAGGQPLPRDHLPRPAGTGGPPLARSAVDRAAARRTDPGWLAAAWRRARVLVINPAGRVLCLAESDPGLVLLDPTDAPPCSEADRLFLGLGPDGTPYFAVVAELPDRPGARPVTLREVGAALDDRDAGLFTTAAALVNWHAAHRFAPATGQPTTVSEGGWLRVDQTGTQIFPRTDPAVIVLVHDGTAGPAGRCLLGHNAAWPARGDGRRFFSTLAGFVEPGESAEAAVAREVYEEVGVVVSDLRYQGSQAWPFPGSLMLGFTGYADPGQPVRPDLSEIAEARWFTRAEIAPLLPDQPVPAGAPAPGGGVTLPGPASIAHHLIRTWLAVS
jgi:NAD+ diphosphatase